MIDLSSDTATRPTAAMRRFMAEAPVGDEQIREDPTVNALQEQVAALTGKQAALFLPSGTMCNAIAFAVHCRRGDAVILDQFAHPVIAEAGGPAVLANVLLRPVAAVRGRFTAAQIRPLLDPGGTHSSRTSLISVENTTNMGGGAVWDLERLAELRDLADEHEVALHMDGARLMNAVVASGQPATAFASHVDTVWIDLSKGLGAPVGAVLAGAAAFIDEARRFKHLFGGAMRQAGIIAAAGTYALEHHVDRLSEDHANAKLLEAGLAAIPGIELVNGPVETNILFFDVGSLGITAAELNERLMAHGVRMSGRGQGSVVRAVTHLDVSRNDCERAVSAVQAVIA
ncbi:MAG: aminotransferase class I/II-fold pyridoxal phosphate-dependent enzyme [Chloroflexia bacterium]|nr:aminotransferase class I/II-fold pyridoxal phosphate-dependent enzyme [Chloroflexia bacterium]